MEPVHGQEIIQVKLCLALNKHERVGEMSKLLEGVPFYVDPCPDLQLCYSFCLGYSAAQSKGKVKQNCQHQTCLD